MYAAKISNNSLTNVADAERFPKASSPAKPGLEEPLRFTVGVHNECSVDGWELVETNSDLESR